MQLALEAVLRDHPDRVVVLDGTERLVRRTTTDEAQRRNYSGKKQRHTRENLEKFSENAPDGTTRPPGGLETGRGVGVQKKVLSPLARLGQIGRRIRVQTDL